MKILESIPELAPDDIVVGIGTGIAVVTDGHRQVLPGEFQAQRNGLYFPMSVKRDVNPDIRKRLYEKGAGVSERIRQ